MFVASVYNQRTRDQVLNSLNQILKLRKAKKRKKKPMIPRSSILHYVVPITDETLILDHVIMEFFREDPTEPRLLHYLCGRRALITF